MADEYNMNGNMQPNQNNNQNGFYSPNGFPQNNNAQVQIAVDAAMKEQKKKKRKKRIIILAVVIVAFVLIGVIASSGNSDSKTVDSITSSNSGETAATDAATDATVADTKVKTGNVVTTDSLKISYISCDSDYKKYHEYSEPASGNKVVRAEFKFENISSSDVSLGSFECYADGKKCEEFYATDDYASPTLETISAGRTFDAVIYFEVPENAAEIELELEDDLWSNSKTTFIVE